MAIGVALIEGIVSLVVMMPVPLSYFNPLVGGLPGAGAGGMEPTYYWDALDTTSREWLASNTQPGRTIEFATFPHSWLYPAQYWPATPRLGPLRSGATELVCAPNRPGAFSDADRALASHGRPAYTVTKLGVPLVWIFPYTSSYD